MTARIALALSGSNLTGEHAFSCCLSVDGELHAATPRPGERGDLAMLARDLLTARGLAPTDLGQLRVDLGPGSYTGLRVALTFARFLQHFGDVPVLACDSLSLLACAVDRRHPRLRPLLDARRGRYYTATLDGTGERLRLVEQPQAKPCAELLDGIDDGDAFVIARVLGEEHRQALRARGAELVEVGAVTAARLFDERLALEPRAAASLEPRYLMASYAE